jgi:acyl-coenzyme A synthetase/AMP-(fatty) acid ligase
MSPPGEKCVDGAVGKPMVPGWPGLKNRIMVARKDLSSCHPDETGEIMIKNQALFTHYLKDPEATQKAMAGGWLHTGDMGKTDQKGWIYFLGRGKDVIRKKGENISASEVEGVLTAHDSVSQAAVIGVSPADALGEEEPMAFVIPARQESPSWPDLIRHCQKNLADFKIPRFWLAVRELPKNATNRVVKEKLKQGDPPETRPGVFDSLAHKEVSG